MFTRDSKFLFSGHGSSTVYQWDLENKQKTPVNQIALLNTAISSLAVSNKVDQPPLVAIAGQFNRFVLWDFDKQTAYEVNYRWDEHFVGRLPFAPVFSQYDYINSLAIANDSPLLATADNRGYISLWNMDKLYRCTQDATLLLGNDRRGNTFKQAQCNDALINQWQGGKDHQPIRAIALTDDGCYLASAGNDGRVLLWTLNGTSGSSPDPMTVAVYPQAKLRSIDIQKPAPNYVLIASDAPQNQVRLYYKQVNSHDCR